ncbi:MAG TPA: MFS transporter, partial [Burkholderiaceae bacterium]|nr:MFS transporter [Burkholderiaceae bacterium]
MESAAAPAPERSRDDLKIITVISIAHGLSHFFHLILIPLFPWIKEAFDLSYAELGLLVTVFFFVSGIGQATAGFIVDRVGAVPVLLASLALFAIAAFGLSLSPNYASLMGFMVVAGIGNAAFHPIDYSIINARIGAARLGRAYAIHGISGNLGWAAAPAFLVGVAQFGGWRGAVAAAGVVSLAILALVWHNRRLLHGSAPHARSAGAAAGDAASTFGFLRLPAVWMSFAFFLAYAFSLGAIQSFGPESARVLHDVPVQL